MSAAFFAADTVNAKPDADAVHSWNDIPEKCEKGNKQCADTNGNAVWFLDKVN